MKKGQITYNTLGEVTTLGFQWLIMMLIPRMTDFTQAGIFAVGVSACSIFNTIGTFFLFQYQVSDQYQKFSENNYFTCRVATIIISFILCFVLIFALQYSVEQSLVILGYMLYRNIINFAYLYLASLQIEEHLDAAGKCMILEGFVSFISFISVYAVTKDLVPSIACMAVIGGGSYLVSLAYCYRKILGKKYPMKFKELETLKPLMMVGIPMLISGLAPIIITALPKLTLQYFIDEEIAGIFSTLTAPTVIIPTLVSGIFAPFIVHFSNLAKRGDMQAIRKNYVKMLLMILGFGLISLIVSLLLAEFAFKLLYGDYIVPYVHYFHYLVIGITMYSLGICSVTVLVTKDQERSAAVASIIPLIIAFGLFVITVPQYGIDAATYGLVGIYSLFGIIAALLVMLKPLKNNSETVPEHQQE